jgi:hypothetical protein
MITAPWCVIEAERQGMAFEEEQRKQRQGYIDPNINEEMAEARRKLLSPKERALDWADRHRYSIVGGSWAASMASEHFDMAQYPYQIMDLYSCIRSNYARPVSKASETL